MARARNIKPAFFKDEDLVELPFETRLLFIGLWGLADREGFLEDRPKRIKMEIFPADNVDCDACLQQLHDAKKIIRYKWDGVAYIEIPGFLRHQHPHQDEKAGEIPGQDGSIPEAPRSKNKKESVQAPGKHQVSTVQASCQHRGNPADSLLLNPDSLNPDSKNKKDLKPYVGKPDVAVVHPVEISQPKPKPNPKPTPQPDPVHEFEEAYDPGGDSPESIIAYLNQRACTNYRPVEANLKLIRARLAEKHTAQDLKRVIDSRTDAWINNPKMAMYLRPATLFNAEKFSQYMGQVGTTIIKTNEQHIDDWINETTGNVIEHEPNRQEKILGIANRADGRASRPSDCGFAESLVASA